VYRNFGDFLTLHPADNEKTTTAGMVRAMFAVNFTNKLKKIGYTGHLVDIDWNRTSDPIILEHFGVAMSSNVQIAEYVDAAL
jgi:hypothetical protein